MKKQPERSWVLRYWQIIIFSATIILSGISGYTLMTSQVKQNKSNVEELIKKTALHDNQLTKHNVEIQGINQQLKRIENKTTAIFQKLDNLYDHMISTSSKKE